MFKKLIKTIGILLPFALLTVVIFLPYLPTTVNQKEVILSVGIDIINDQIRPKTPMVIKMDNCYQTKIQILSPYQIDMSYDGKNISSNYVYGDVFTSQQTIEFELPVVEGTMTFNYFPNKAEIRLMSNNQYFTVTYYKPIGKHCFNLLRDIILFLIIISMAIITKEVIKYLIKKIKH